MATVTDWIKHLTTDVDGSAVGTQVQGAIYPGVGSEGILVLFLQDKRVKNFRNLLEEDQVQMLGKVMLPMDK